MRLSRLLAIVVPTLSVALVSAAPWQTEASAARELDEDQQILHVLHRLAFGPRPGDVARVRAIGVDRWIAQQLEPSRVDDPRGAALARAYPSLAQSPAELYRAYPPPNVLQRAATQRRATMSAADSQALRAQAREGRAFVGELLSARVARAVVSERQLEEVMTDFWLNHFSVFIGKNQLMRYQLPAYEREVIRPHVLGTFRALLGAVATSPAMLIYLDNAQSVADSSRPTLVDRQQQERRLRRVRGAIARNASRGGDQARIDSAQFEQLMARRPRGLNENYARELLELHTLGVDGGYTQQDVIEVARALTGWTVRPAAGGRGRGGEGFTFNPAAHDAGEKTVLGQTLRAHRGVEDGEAVLDLLARHPSTAKHIAYKLAVRLVSDEPPAGLVTRAAETFRRTDGNIREVVRTIVTSPEFFSRAAYRSKVKSPFETVVSTARALGATADTTPVTAALVARLGQPIFGRQSPDGWPETGEAWMNTGAILNRINFGMAVAANRLPGARLVAWPSYATLRSAPRDQQVQGVIDGLLGGRVSVDTRAVLERGTNPLLEDSTRTPDVEVPTMERRRNRQRSADTSNMTPPPGAARDRGNPLRAPAFGRVPTLNGLDQIIGLALGSPEFQRR